jgi:hypothetical protein
MRKAKLREWSDTHSGRFTLTEEKVDWELDVDVEKERKIFFPKEMTRQSLDP